MRRINAVFQASTNKLVDPRSSWKTTYDAEAKMNSDMDYLWGSAMVLTLGLLGLTVAAATLK